MIPNRATMNRNGALLRSHERKAPAPVVTLAGIEAAVVAMSSRDAARAARLLREMARGIRKKAA
jgi:hypothetical protein